MRLKDICNSCGVKPAGGDNPSFEQAIHAIEVEIRGLLRNPPRSTDNNNPEVIDWKERLMLFNSKLDLIRDEFAKYPWDPNITATYPIQSIPVHSSPSPQPRENSGPITLSNSPIPNTSQSVAEPSAIGPQSGQTEPTASQAEPESGASGHDAGQTEPKPSTISHPACSISIAMNHDPTVGALKLHCKAGTVRTCRMNVSLILALAFGCVCARATDDLVVGDFDGDSYGEWATTGTAFSKGPAHNLKALEIEDAVGSGAASSEIDGDQPQGSLTSPEFKVQRRYISFRIGGGDYERHACMNLLIGGKSVRSATGRNSDHLRLESWDVQDLSGKSARIQIVDEASGRWGHINVDHIVQTDAPETLPANSTPLYEEALRPQFHFTARQWTMNRLNPGMRQEGWLNDLNGLIYLKGEYHLFAQRWNKCWIHAVSKDLVHWNELEPAFWEERLDSGVQSGTCVYDFANSSGLGKDAAHPPLVAFWSRNDNKSQCLSFSLDEGRSWQHHTNNPIFVHPERDPKVFWYEPTHRWVMFLYGEQDRQRAYHIFTSTNLLSWTDEKHPIANSYECPDFFQLPLDGNTNQMKWLLVRGDGRYSIGDFDGHEFKEQTHQLESDSGPNFYATQTFADAPNGRRVQIAWMRGGIYPDMPFNQQITFPRELTLRTTANGPRLFRNPVREIESLRSATKASKDLSLSSTRAAMLTKSGDLYRIEAFVEFSQGAAITLDLRGVKLTLTSRNAQLGGNAISFPTPLRKFEILMDRTSIEFFANDGETTVSKCFIPTGSAITAIASSGQASFPSLRVTSLTSAWK